MEVEVEAEAAEAVAVEAAVAEVAAEAVAVAAAVAEVAEAVAEAAVLPGARERDVRAVGRPGRPVVVGGIVREFAGPLPSGFIT